MVDVIIILTIVFGAILGFKRGFTHSFLSCVGLILVVILAYFLKNPVSQFFYTYLPFFKFGGILKGITVLNILVYELIAFFLVLGILMFFYKTVILVSKIFEKLLKATIILGIPSKLLGMIFGAIQSFILVFLLLYVVSLPVFSFSELKESKFAKPILTQVPILNTVAKKMVGVADEFGDLAHKYKEEPDAQKFNLETLDLFLKYKVIDPDSVQKLVDKGKLAFDKGALDAVLLKHKEE